MNRCLDRGGGFFGFASIAEVAEMPRRRARLRILFCVTWPIAQVAIERKLRAKIQLGLGRNMVYRCSNGTPGLVLARDRRHLTVLVCGASIVGHLARGAGTLRIEQ